MYAIYDLRYIIAPPCFSASLLLQQLKLFPLCNYVAARFPFCDDLYVFAMLTTKRKSAPNMHHLWHKCDVCVCGEHTIHNAFGALTHLFTVLSYFGMFLLQARGWSFEDNARYFPRSKL